MIRINLIPTKRKKKAKPVPGFIIALVLVLIVTVVAVGWATFWVKGEISSRKAQLSRDQQKLTELKKKVKEVEDYEKNNAEFEQKKNVIEELKRNQNAPTRFMHELAANLADGVWIEKLSERNWRVTIKGFGFSNTDIVNYMDNLKRSPYVTDVQLSQTSQVVREDVELYSFEASFTIKV